MSTRHLEYRVYDADTPNKPGFVAGAGGAVASLYAHRDAIIQAVLADIRDRFAKTVLGRLWAIILPLVPVSAYLFLRLVLGSPLEQAGMEPATYVVVGVTMWFLLADSVYAPIKSLAHASRPTSGDNFPLLVSMAIEMARVWVEFLIRLLPVVTAVFLLEGALPAVLPLAIALLAACSLFAFSLGIYLALLQLALPDTENILQITLRYGIFLSLAVFPLGTLMTNKWLLLNPFAIAIDNLRQLLVLGSFSTIAPFVVMCAVGSILLLTSLYFTAAGDLRFRGLL